MTEKQTVLVTGASGLLGRSIVSELEKNSGFTIIKCAFSRTRDGYVKMNLLNEADIQETLQRFRPCAVIHCAAERFPNKVEENLEEVKKLNVRASEVLALEADKIGAFIIYISTDYVFDGLNPPYSEDSVPNPVNKYGATKLLGEKAVLGVNPANVVLRVPVLYGPVTSIEESAITVLLKAVREEKPQLVSDIEIRYPSHTEDISYIVHQLLKLKLNDTRCIHGIYHWSGKEALTKFQMVKVIANVLGLTASHISPDRDETKLSTGPLRPKNCQLSAARIDDLGIGKHTPFSDGILCALRKHV
ncbi:methionine adenosyltransferase 2 subunit beta-like isoform X2 [Artemia franciscana]|uniref:Methionine adenosyltransferase 2 subunit beta n=2 Tax=Artemia franciscana TaxID=6661 RepID=A0AA88I141_ARTSF|nr:hypothetical protein QYM36_006777 [Artemia franciscana]